MTDGWFDRLKEAIEVSGISKKRLSKAAGRGQNFVQQMLKDGKQPGIENLSGLLEALGQEATIYVLTGERITPDQWEFVKLFSSISDPESQDHAIAVLEALAAKSADNPEPPASEAH